MGADVAKVDRVKADRHGGLSLRWMWRVWAGTVDVAESEGFEPPDLLQSTVFKTAAFDRSANSPVQVVFGADYI